MRSFSFHQIATMSIPPPPPEYLVPLSTPYGDNWGSVMHHTQTEPTIPGLDLVNDIDDPMDLEETETFEPETHEPTLQKPFIPMLNQEVLLVNKEACVFNHTNETDSGRVSPAILREVKEEDEEGKLRAKLLKSLMRRRQEKIESEVGLSKSV